MEETRPSWVESMGMHCGRPRNEGSSLDLFVVRDFFVQVMTSWGALSSAWSMLVSTCRFSTGIEILDEENPTEIADLEWTYQMVSEQQRPQCGDQEEVDEIGGEFPRP